MTPDPTSLDRLHDVIAPPPVPWWPPAAPGWYWFGSVVLILLIAFVLSAVSRVQRNRYRREALTEWDRESVRLGDARTRMPALASLAVLLKRVSLTAFSRTTVAPLTGRTWTAFLNQTAPAKDFDDTTLLERTAYGELPEREIDESRAREAAALVRRWIRTHRSDGETGGKR